MFFNSRRLVRRLPRKAGWLVSGDPWHELIGTTWSSYVILIRSITSIIPAVQPAGLPRVSNSGPSGRLHMSSNIRRATSTYSGFARSLQTVSSCLECIVVPRCFWSPPISFCRTSLQENSVSPASYGDAVIKVAERKTNARPSSVRLQIAVLATLNGGDRSPCLLCFAMQAWPPAKQPRAPVRARLSLGVCGNSPNIPAAPVRKRATQVQHLVKHSPGTQSAPID